MGYDPYSSVLEVCRRFGGNLCLRHYGTRLNLWWVKISLKYGHITTRLHGVSNKYSHRGEELKTDN
jgi:hypothetical protein